MSGQPLEDPDPSTLDGIFGTQESLDFMDFKTENTNDDGAYGSKFLVPDDDIKRLIAKRKERIAAMNREVKALETIFSQEGSEYLVKDPINVSSDHIYLQSVLL